MRPIKDFCCQNFECMDHGKRDAVSRLAAKTGDHVQSAHDELVADSPSNP